MSYVTTEINRNWHKRSMHQGVSSGYHYNMNLGMPEMIFIFLLALIIFGPRKLPEIGREIGKALAEFKRASNEFKSQLENEIDQISVEEERKKYREKSEKLLKEAQAMFSVESPQDAGVARTLGDAGVTTDDLKPPEVVEDLKSPEVAEEAVKGEPPVSESEAVADTVPAEPAQPHAQIQMTPQTEGRNV
jgi:TatA/E family protein of Tat protein translocase